MHYRTPTNHRRTLRASQNLPDMDASDWLAFSPNEPEETDSRESTLFMLLLLPVLLLLPFRRGATCTAASTSATLALPTEYLAIEGMSDRCRIRSMMSCAEGGCVHASCHGIGGGSSEILVFVVVVRRGTESVSVYCAG